MKTFKHLKFSFLLMMVALLGFASVADAQTGNVALFRDGPNATRFTGTVPRFYLNPAEVQSSGVQVEMVVVGLENASIDEYGIIWSEKAQPDYYKNSGRQALSMPMTEGNHTYLIKGLRQNGVYFAYGYVVIKGVMFISNEISFENSVLAAGMRRAASRASAAVTGCGTVFGETFYLDEDNENNAGTGVSDKDFGKEDYKIYNEKYDSDYKNIHPIEFNLFTSKDALMDGILAINAYDVDEEPNADGFFEVDGVYFNGTRVGALSGNNDTWNTTTFRIPKEAIKKGKNLVQVKVDERNEGWYVIVHSAQFLINGGVGDKGSIGELTINSAEKSGSTVNVKIAADLKVCTPTNFAIETNLIAPDKSNVYTAKTTFSASSDVDNKELSLQLPLGSMTGTYTANFYLFDNTAGVMLHSASINIEHTQNVGVNPLVVAIIPSTEIVTENPVVLTCKAKSVISSKATIIGIQAPGASAHNGKAEALYTAEKNGTYTFKVYYTEDGSSKTKDFSYTVNNITLKKQTISWSQDLSNLKVDVPFTLVATASSNQPVKFSMSQSANATLVGNVLTFKKADQAVTVTASQDGGSGYEAASSIVKSIKAAKGSSENVEFPSIGGGTGGSSGPVVSGDAITFPAKTDDGRNITYTITPSDAGTQKTENGKVVITIAKAGQATITATIAPTADYEEIKKDFPVTVAKGNQTITWNDDFSALKVNKPMVLTAKSSVTDMVVTYESSDALIATITEGNKLTVLQANKDVTIKAIQKGNANYNPATVVEKTVKAAKGENTITWNQTFTDVKVDEPIELPALTSTTGMNVVYSSSDPLIATITQKDGKTYLTFLQFDKEVNVVASAGTGDANYEEAKVEKTVKATKKGSKPNVEFPDISGETGGGQPQDKPSVDKTYEYPAQTSDGRDIIYTVNPADAATQTKEDDKVIISLGKAGDITITATIKGTPDYDEIVTVIPVKVEKCNQVITWKQDLSALQVNVPVTLNAVSDKKLLVTYKSSDETAATISEGKLTVLKYNTEVTITATQVGNDNYNAAPEVKLTAKATQKGDPSVEADYPVIEEGANAPKVDEPIVFPAQTKDGRDIVYTITPQNAGKQETKDGKVTITITEAGDVKITATIQGGTDYKDVVKEFPVKTQKGNQLITWTQDLSALQVNTPVTLNAVSDKSLPIIYKSLNTSVATVDGNKLTVLKYNTVVEIAANQVGNDNYNAAPEVKLTAKATQKGDPSVEADYPVIEEGANAPKVDEPIVFPAQTKDGRDIVYTITPQNAGKQETKDGKVTITITEVSDVKITATIQGGADYKDVVKEFPVKTQKGNQLITWTQDLSALQVNTPVTLNAVSDKSLPIIYKSLNTSVATVDGNKLTVLKYNTAVEITANQVGNDNYNAAPEVKLTVKATQKGDPSVEADYPVIEEGTNAPKVDEPIVFPAQTKDGRDIVYTITPQNAGKQETKDGKVTITITEAGDVKITATIQGGADYKDVVKEFPVKTQKGNQLITWTQDLSALQVNTPVTLNAVSDKSLPIIYKSLNTSVATVDGNKLTVLKYNTAVEITATQVGNDNYNAASEVKLTAKATQKGIHTITWNQTFDLIKVGEAFDLKAVSSQNLTVIYESSNTEIATVENNQLTFHKYDMDVVITAKASNDDFAEAQSTKTLKANVKGTPSIDAEYPTIDEGEKAPRPGDELVFPGKTDDGKDIIYEISPAGSATQEKKDDNVIITIEKNTEITIEAIVKGDGVDTDDNIKEIIIGVNQKGAQTLSWDQTIVDLTVGDKLLLTAATTSGRNITYTLSDQTCGKITNDYYFIPAKEMTSVTLTAIVNEDDDYLGSNQLEKVFAIKPLIIDDSKDLGEIVIPEGLEEEVVVTVTETGNVKLSSSDNEEKTIKQLVINQKDDEVGSVYTDDHTKIYPSILTLKAEFTPGRWHFISMPFDINLSNLDLKYSEDYAVAYYDAEQRAANKRDNWKIIPTATTLKAGQGYLIRVMKDNLVFNFTTNDQPSIREALTFGDINKPLVYENNEGKASAYNSGWNFVGVPYLSEYLAEPSDKILYVYDEKEQNYVVVSKDLDTKSMILNPWSGFLLQSGSTEDALKFTADNRVAPGKRAMAYVSENAPVDGNRFVFELRANGRMDKTFVVLDPAAHKDYVINEDAAKFFSMDNTCPQIYTLVGDGSVALNKLPEQNAQLTIDLITSATANDECEIVLTEKPSEYKDVVLSSSLGQIKLEENKPYAFTSAGENKFELIVSRSTVNIGEYDMNSACVYTVNSNVIIKGLPSGTTVRIASVAGKLIYMDSLFGEDGSYQLPERGVYLVTLSVDGLDKTFKIIY